MKRFKDFGIKPMPPGLVGDKIKMDRILNREITVYGNYRIEDSKYTDKCLYMQISIGEIKYVVFTGSAVLMELIEQVPKNGFPFVTTIVKENERFEFT